MRTGTEIKVKMVFLRHGETAANARHCYLGRTEEPLSAEGRERLYSYRMAGRYPAVDVLFASPRKRCLETAELLYPEHRPIVIDAWAEMDFGAFEGKNYEDLKGDARYQAWIDSNGTLPFPEGESREAFIARTKTGLYQMLSFCKNEKIAASAEREIPVLGAVVHGGTIMALFSSFLPGDYYDYQVKNGAGYSCILYAREKEAKEGEAEAWEIQIAELQKVA